MANIYDYKHRNVQHLGYHTVRALLNLRRRIGQWIYEHQIAIRSVWKFA